MHIDVPALQRFQRSRRDDNFRGGADGVLALAFDGYDNKFDLRLEHTAEPFAEDFRVDVVDESGDVRTVQIDMNVFYRGRLVGKGTEDSDVRAQITEQGLTATIKVQGELYGIEPVGLTNYSHLTRDRRHSDTKFNHILTNHRFVEKHPDETSTCGAGSRDHAHGGMPTMFTPFPALKIVHTLYIHPIPHLPFKLKSCID